MCAADRLFKTVNEVRTSNQAFFEVRTSEMLAKGSSWGHYCEYK
jgi:hypothetical protein